MIKYLTHELVPCNKFELNSFDYECKICGIILYHIFDSYAMVYIDNFGEDQSENDQCNLTCEEYMIKSIIE